MATSEDLNKHVRTVIDMLMKTFDEVEEVCFVIMSLVVDQKVNFDTIEKVLEFCNNIPCKMPGLEVQLSRHASSTGRLNELLNKLDRNTNCLNIYGDFYKQCICGEENSIVSILQLNHPAMNTLDLRHNLIEDDGAILIAKALAKNTTLQTLYMGYNFIRGEAIKAFAEALSENSTLKKIDLAFLINDPSGMPGKGTLDEESVIAMATALGKHKGLTYAFWEQYDDPGHAQTIRDALVQASIYRWKEGLPYLAIRQYGRKEVDFRKKDYFESIQKVVKQVHPELTFSGFALERCNELLKSFSTTLAKNAASIQPQNSTITHEAMKKATKEIVIGELEKHAQQEAGKAISKYQMNKNSSGGVWNLYDDLGQKAGLIFDVKRVEDDIDRMDPGLLYTREAVVFLAAVLDYLCAELVELSGNMAKDDVDNRGNSEIRKDDLEKAIDKDPELKRTLIEAADSDAEMESASLNVQMKEMQSLDDFEDIL